MDYTESFLIDTSHIKEKQVIVMAYGNCCRVSNCYVCETELSIFGLLHNILTRRFYIPGKVFVGNSSNYFHMKLN